MVKTAFIASYCMQKKKKKITQKLEQKTLVRPSRFEADTSCVNFWVCFVLLQVKIVGNGKFKESLCATQLNIYLFP